MEGSAFSLLLMLVVFHHVNSQQNIWTIAMGSDWGSHEYRNAEGFVVGFGPEFMDAVCTEGNMDCRIVSMPYSSCFLSNPGVHPSGGRALHSRWVDGCSSWVGTVERIHVFTFTQSWVKGQPSNLYIRQGETLDLSDRTVFDNKKIGFLAGWSSSEQCLARGLVVLDPDQIVHKETTAEILDALLRKEIYAVFSSENGWTADQRSKITRVDRDIPCSVTDTAIMTRKDSALPALFNTAFNKLKNTGWFPRFCTATNAKHSSKGDPVECKF